MTNVESVTNSQSSLANRVVLETQEIDGITYVPLDELKKYDVKQKRRQLNCIPDTDLYARISAYCATENMSRSSLVIEALATHMARLEKMGC